MSTQLSASVRPFPSPATRDLLIRAAIGACGALGLLLVPLHTTCAQSAAAPSSAPPANRWDLRFTSGALVPTGNQRNALKDAQASAVQFSWLVLPSLAVTGTFGWARSRDLASVATPKLDVFTSDLGVEARSAKWFAGRAVTLIPFAGVGAGARSYNYRKLDVDATNNLAGYVAVGGEVAVGRVGLRLEARDYATGFKPLVGAGTSATRNDIVIMAGLSFNRRRALQQ